MRNVYAGPERPDGKFTRRDPHFDRSREDAGSFIERSSIDIRYLVNACAMSTQVQNVQMENLQLEGGISALTDLEKMPVPSSIDRSLLVNACAMPMQFQNVQNVQMESLQGGLPTSTDLEKMPVRSFINSLHSVNACAMPKQVQNLQMDGISTSNVIPQPGFLTSTDSNEGYQMPVRLRVISICQIVNLMTSACLG